MKYIWVVKYFPPNSTLKAITYIEADTIMEVIANPIFKFGEIVSIKQVRVVLGK